MKLKSVVLAAALAVSAGGSFANTVFTAPGSFTGTFSETFEFTIGIDSFLTGASVTAVLTPAVGATTGFDIDSVSFAKDGGGGPAISYAGVDTAVGGSLFQQFTAAPVPTLLAAGTYLITVKGSSLSAGAGYSGNVTLTPVPEPETYAMMLAGLAAVGFMAKRRRQG